LLDRKEFYSILLSLWLGRLLKLLVKTDDSVFLCWLAYALVIVTLHNKALLKGSNFKQKKVNTLSYNGATMAYGRF